jgi:hypothetical protein
MPLIDTIIAAFPDEAPVARATASQNSPLLTAQVLTVDGGRMDYIGHG